jgi:acetyl esterase
MHWFISHYLRSDEDKSDWRASPLLAGNLAGVAPALVMTAGFDPLSDEGDAYAEALRQAGVPVRHERFEGQIHGFATMGRIISDSGRAIAMIAKAVQEPFSRGSA